MWLYAKVQKWCTPRVVLTRKNIKGKVEGPQEPKNVKTTKYGLLKSVQTKKIKRDWEIELSTILSILFLISPSVTSL